MAGNGDRCLNAYVTGLSFCRTVRSGSVLVVDSEELARTVTERGFRDLGWETRGCESAKEGVELIAADPPEIVVTELKLNDASGLTLLSISRVNSPKVKVAIATAWPSIATAVQATKWGASDYVVKPVNVAQLIATVTQPPCQCTPTGVPVSQGAPLPEYRPSLRRLQWEHVQRAIIETGSVAGAARLLGVDRRSLRRTLAKYPHREGEIDGDA